MLGFKPVDKRIRASWQCQDNVIEVLCRFCAFLKKKIHSDKTKYKIFIKMISKPIYCAVWVTIFICQDITVGVCVHRQFTRPSCTARICFELSMYDEGSRVSIEIRAVVACLQLVCMFNVISVRYSCITETLIPLH